MAAHVINCVQIRRRSDDDIYTRVIKIEGSVELAPILDLADGIVDIVETGATLRENGLVPIEDVAQVSARLIVNTASMKLHKAQIEDLIGRCEAELKRRREET